MKPHFFFACSGGNEEVVKYLVELGADINEKARFTGTSIFKACSSGNEALVKYLIELGADTNKKMNLVNLHYFLRVIVEIKQ